MKIRFLCAYGCGQEGKYLLRSVIKFCCSKSNNSCPELRLANSKANIGKKISPESIAKRVANSNFKGENNPMYGKNHTEETKRKISDTRIKKGLAKGRKNPMFGRTHTDKVKRRISRLNSGPNNHNYGKPVSDEVKAKISASLSGPNNYGWRGGTSRGKYCSGWSSSFRDYIIDRDGNKCSSPHCWGNSDKLCGHHINYNKMNCHPWNLITLCSSCNIRANKDRGYWQGLYQYILYERGIRNPL